MPEIPISGLPAGGPLDGTEQIPAVQGGLTVRFPSAALVGPSGGGLPTGVILPFAGTVAPAGYLFCDGSTAAQATYPALFTLLGTTWGPAAGGLFTLPDLRDRTLIGLSPGGLGPDRPTLRNLGDVGGEEDHVLTISELATHKHGVTDPGHQHLSPDGSDFYTHAPAVFTGTAGAKFGDSGGNMVQSSTTGVSTLDNGLDDAHNTMQPFAAVAWIIKT